MNIQTECGIEIYCLPDNKCTLTGENVFDMDECPCKAFDAYGERCVPESCVYYTEEE